LMAPVAARFLDLALDKLDKSKRRFPHFGQ
jgi:hypothetical protein